MSGSEGKSMLGFPLFIFFSFLRLWRVGTQQDALLRCYPHSVYPSKSIRGLALLTLLAGAHICESHDSIDPRVVCNAALPRQRCWQGHQCRATTGLCIFFRPPTPSFFISLFFLLPLIDPLERCCWRW